MTDQTMEPVTQQQGTVTKQKNPMRIEQGERLVQYNPLQERRAKAFE